MKDADQKSEYPIESVVQATTEGALDNEELKEPAVTTKRVKLEAGVEVTKPVEGAAAAGQDVMRGLEDEIAKMKKKNSRVYYVFDMQVPGAIFIKIADWARPHIDVKKVGLEIVKHVKETGEL